MKIELDIVCPECKGTGLYVGMAEKDGFAVQCHRCNGTGKYHYVYEYELFEARKKRRDVKWVVEYNPGIFIGTKHGALSLSDFGGMSYKDWNTGKLFPTKSEMRRFTCPAWWYQCVNYDLKPDWGECICCGSFSECPNFSSKNKCWERWDREYRKKEKCHDS